MMGGGGGPSGHFASVGAGHLRRMGGDHFSSGAWGGSRSAHRQRRRLQWSVGAPWPHSQQQLEREVEWELGSPSHHHFNNRFFFTSGPFFYGDYYAYGYGNCAWLRRQAIITGSPYWRNRYQTCLYD